MAELLEKRILVCTPYGKDAKLACHVLESSGLQGHICQTLPELFHELGKGAGAVLTTEEALPASAIAILHNHLSLQPAWSDLPILVLTKPGGDSPWVRQAYERLGNLTLLERPVRSPTLVSAVRSALRARLRQYEIRAADQRKDEFLAMLAHELRNPLAPVSAAADLLKLVSSDAAQVKSTSEVIARQVGHMTNLIDDLLDVARVTRGLITYKKDLLDVRQLLSEAIEQVSPLVATRRHQMELHLPPDSAPVIGDKERIIQVIANMLGNAVKYTPEGGKIIVRLEVKSDEVMLEISDNGIGMNTDMVSQVFDLFAQAERTPDRSQGGLGLGLALVKNLTVAHGGNVFASSMGIGKGSTFSVRLPRAVPQPFLVPNEKIIQEQQLSAAQSLRIMVVDDNIDAANMMEMFLSATGHQVSVDYLASTAMERASLISPHVCLLDVGLPDMDGHELAKRLRAMPETATSVFIAVTGYGQESDKEKSRAAGFHHHFVKPVNTVELAKLLSQIPTLL